MMREKHNTRGRFSGSRLQGTKRGLTLAVFYKERLTPFKGSRKNKNCVIAFALLSLCAVCFSSCGGGGGGTTFTQPQVTLKKAVQVAAGDIHTCAIISDGTVKCWGNNVYGQIGNNLTTNSINPQSVIGINNAKNISAGATHSCSVASDGTAACWGEYVYLGNNVQVPPESCVLGDSSTSPCSKKPISVFEISTGISISSGLRHSCVLLSDKMIKCWGRNDVGNLGDGSRDPSLIPVNVVNIVSAVAVAAGGLHTCALLSDGTVNCWGYNDNGELGIGTSAGPQDCNGLACSLSPVEVKGLTDAIQISAGGDFTCALLANGKIKCWGINVGGELGNGTSSGPEKCTNFNYSCSTSPVEVLNVNNAVGIASGFAHTCALLSDGGIVCWGQNNSGQLGNKSKTSSNTAVTVSGVTNALSIKGGYRHTCAIFSDGTLACWGSNEYGQLGIGKDSSPEDCGYPCYTVPVAVDASLYAAVPRAVKNFFFAFADIFNRLTSG